MSSAKGAISQTLVLEIRWEKNKNRILPNWYWFEKQAQAPIDTPKRISPKNRARKIFRIMKDEGLSQAEVARKLGVSRAMISKTLKKLQN
jgi:DNA-directed RNA polymerase specialized sigma subunit